MVVTEATIPSRSEAGDGVPSSVRAVGSMLGSFRLDRHVATGGMGTVYEAHDLRRGQRVAVKMPLPELAEVPELFVQFSQEASVLARIDHPNVVRMFRMDEDEAGPYLILEYLEGETLADRAARGAFTVPEVVNIVSQLAAALAEVHAQGFVHCDVKPANVFLARDDSGQECVKLIDFGICVEKGPGQGDEAPVSMRGSPSYMAPEQLCGCADLDGRADQFALAAMTFDLLAGKTASTNGGSVTLATLRGQRVVPMSDVVPGVPSACDAVLRRATTVHREDRYDDVLAFSAALEAATGEAPSSWRQLSAAPYFEYACMAAAPRPS